MRDKSDIAKLADDDNYLEVTDPKTLLDHVRVVIEASEYHKGIVEDAFVMILTDLMLKGMTPGEVAAQVARTQKHCEAIHADVDERMTALGLKDASQ